MSQAEMESIESRLRGLVSVDFWETLHHHLSYNDGCRKQ